MFLSRRCLNPHSRSMVTSALALLVILAGSPSAIAQSPTTLTPSSAPVRSVTVSPPNLVLDGKPGEVVNQVIHLENNSDVQQQVVVSIRNFKPTAEIGQAAPTDEDSTYSMVRWMSVAPKTRLLEPAERVDFAVAITIPANAEPGSHFGSVVFTPSPKDTPKQGFVTTTEVSTLVLLKTPGDARQTSTVETFTASVDGDRRGPVTFTTRIANTGSVHFIPTGTIKVTDLLGRTIATIPFNTQANPVLPEAVRRLETTWDTGRLIGRYKAQLDLTYPGNVDGEADKELSSSTTFIVTPPPLVSIAAAVVLALIVLVLIRRKRRVAKPAGRHSR